MLNGSDWKKNKSHINLSSCASVCPMVGAASQAYRYKKAGVMLLDLVPAQNIQAGLFQAPNDARSLARMAALDALSARFGRDTVHLCDFRNQAG